MDEQIAPFHPIIYVRGYAMSAAEINETTADPFCGFNLGSTVYRAVADETKVPRKFVFESPLLRLGSDFGYRDVYEDGYDILDSGWSMDGSRRLPYRSIIIHRYYDESSSLLGSGKVESIETFAKSLSVLIARVRGLVCENPDNGVTSETFRCYLVAHSMGGLVCRAFLQGVDENGESNDPEGVSRCVDKFFTYATPHNGIDLSPFGGSGPGGLNVPSWLTKADLSNFNRKNMARYLNLADTYQKTDRVDWIREDKFPGDKVFCLVGTNRLDYEVAWGLSRNFVGHGSDGLVRIANATLCSLKADGTPGEPCAKGFVYRSHSGYFGIVNSEESYQNLTRFLFGDARVDIWLEFSRIQLPAAFDLATARGRAVDALYRIELSVGPRGKPWLLSRRRSEEDSVACLTQKEWESDPGRNRSKHLATIFLANRERVRKDRPTLAYAVSVTVRMPDYEVDQRLQFDDQYEGAALFQDTVVIEMLPPQVPGNRWRARWAWQHKGVVAPDTEADVTSVGPGRVELRIDLPVEASAHAAGVEGQLRFVVSTWNAETGGADRTAARLPGGPSAAVAVAAPSLEVQLAGR